MVGREENTWPPNANISLSVLKNESVYYDLILLVVMLDGFRKHFHASNMLSFTGKRTRKNIWCYGACVRLKTWHIRVFWGLGRPRGGELYMQSEKRKNKVAGCWLGLICVRLKSCHIRYENYNIYSSFSKKKQKSMCEVVAAGSAVSLVCIALFAMRSAI